jgi:uncharacterized protein
VSDHAEPSRPSTPPPPVPPPGAPGSSTGEDDASPESSEPGPPPPPWSARQAPPASPLPDAAPPAPDGSHVSAGGSHVSPGGSHVSPGGSHVSPGGSHVSPGGLHGPVPGARPGPPERPGLDDRERTLDPRVVHVWRIMTAIGLAIPLVPGSVIAMVALGRFGLLVPLGAVVLLVVFAGWYPRARFTRWRWRLAPQALELSYGVVVRTHEAVPYFRIQQIDVAQGPLDRLLDLATLQVTTASASGSAALPGVPAEQAPLVRAELLARASEAVSQHEGDLRDAV